MTFANNGATLASGDGGGLGTGAATVSLTATTFSGNYALREGGGIYNRGTLTVSNSTFTGNGAYNGGGGILNWFGSAVIVNSTLSGNSASGSGIGYGGGILNRNAPMTLTATTVCGNTAHYDGGGIYNSGTLSLNGATVCNNTMDGGDEVGMPPLGGGGIFNAGTANVFSSTLSGNRVFQLDGGGLYNRGGTAFVGNSTLNGNTAAQDGGGIKNENGVVTVQNSTVSGNSAVEWGGGILSNFGQTNLLHVTLSGNAAIAGGGIYQLTTDPNRKVYLQNTLIANSKPENCAQFSGSLDVVSGGYNLSDDNAFNAVSGFCPSFGGTDLANATDNLGPLANNGGPTRTHLPLPGSQAIDAIPIGANGCGTTYTGDQRQLPRPLDGNGDLVAKCDVGAVEYLLGEKTPMLYLPLIRR